MTLFEVSQNVIIVYFPCLCIYIYLMYLLFIIIEMWVDVLTTFFYIYSATEIQNIQVSIARLSLWINIVFILKYTYGKGRICFEP